MANNEIKDHYVSPGLLQRIVQGLEAIGKSPASVELDDLAAVDEFHLRGPAATQELIEILEVGADSHVLDVGSGLGGPARHLAKATGCRVTGVDLSEDYCAVGNKLTGCRRGVVDDARRDLRAHRGGRPQRVPSAAQRPDRPGSGDCAHHLRLGRRHWRLAPWVTNRGERDD